MSGLSEEGMRELLYLLPVGVLRFDRGGRILAMNPRVVQMLLPVVGPAALADAFALLRPLVPELASLLHNAVGDEPIVSVERRLLDPEQRALVVDVVLHRQPGGFLAVLTDVTEQAEARRRLRAEEQRFRTIVEAVEGYAIYSTDAAGRVDSWNRSTAQVFGRDDGVGLDIADLMGVASAGGSILDAARETGWQQLRSWVEIDGVGRRFLETMLSPLDGQRPATGQCGFVVVTRDRTDEQQAHEVLEAAASTDPLTGLPNRRAFEAAWVQIATTREAPHSMMLMDLDHFKSVNDTHGHDIGDEVLEAVAGVLSEQCRGGDVPGRLGGEEFAVLLPQAGLDEAVRAADRIRLAVAAIEVPLPDGGTLQVTTSIGVAPLRGGLEPALKAADLALYEAKHGGRNRVVRAPDVPVTTGEGSPPSSPAEATAAAAR